MVTKTTRQAGIAQTKDERQRDPAEDLITIFDRIAQRQPNDTAVVSLHQKDHLGIGALRWTYSQLRDGSICLAHQLIAAGLRKGTRIATFLFNEIEWAILFLASARVGCHFVPLDPRTLDQPSDAVYLLRKVWAESIFVSNISLAKSVENILQTELMPQVRLKGVVSSGQIDSSPAMPRGWTSLSSIMARPHSTDSSMASLKSDDTILMLCTSGTTSRPKVCPHTSVTIVTPALGLADHWSLTPEDTLCQHLPSFHVFNVAMTLAFWVSGGTVVFPSAVFNPAATFDGIASAAGGRAWVPSVPTMIHALHTYSMTTDEKLPAPFGICLGGAPITPDSLRTSRALGAKKIVAGYGTTEGVATLYNIMDAEGQRITNVQDGDDVCLGTAVAGTHLRICNPGSRKPLQRGEIGELHQGGYPIFDGYYQGSDEDNSTCYREGTVSWFATGDRGYMDENGCIYLLGRYKELIIRAGENISPLKVEQCLSSQPGVTSAAVVGVPDDIAGEVPVAVVETVDKNGAEAFFQGLQSAVVQALGRSFAPKLILHLQNHLERERYPTTTSGKIKKNVVQELVLEHLGGSRKTQTSQPQQNSSIQPKSSIYDLTEELTTCWSSVSGLGPQEIRLDTQIRTFTDSTMLIQFLHLARKKGWKFTLKDLLKADTIEKQAYQLARGAVKPQSSPAEPAVSTDVAASDIKIQRAAARLGCHESDIEELIPMTGLFRLFPFDRPFPGAWDHRMAFSIRRDLCADQIVAIVETWLRRHEILRSKVATFENEPPVYAVMHPSESWLKHQIIRGPEVDSLDGVENYQPKNHVDVAAGPLCKVIILPFGDASHFGLIIHAHHVIFDGMVMERWVRDLNHLFDGQQRLQWFPYREFAAMYENYRSSLEAEESVEYFVRKFSGIASSKDAIWNIHRVIRSLYDENIIPTDRRSSTVTPKRTNQDTLPNLSVRLPDPAQMRSRFGISVPIIALAACALLNVRHTGAREAIFTNLQSGRSWPNEEAPGVDEAQPHEIGGPTMANLPIRIPIAQEDTVLDVLNRVRDEQEEMMLNAHAPLDRFHELMKQGPNGAANYEVLYSLLTGQTFDWLVEPYSQVKDDPLAMIRESTLAQTEWAWMPRLTDGNILHLHVYHADANLPVEKVNNIAEQFMCTAAWLADPAHAQLRVSACAYEGYKVRASGYYDNVENWWT